MIQHRQTFPPFKRDPATRQPGPETHDHILDAAEAMLVEHGVEVTSTRMSRSEAEGLVRWQVRAAIQADLESSYSSTQHRCRSFREDGPSSMAEEAPAIGSHSASGLCAYPT